MIRQILSQKRKKDSELVILIISFITAFVIAAILVSAFYKTARYITGKMAASAITYSAADKAP